MIGLSVGRLKIGEDWRWIKGFIGRYEVSNLGNVREYRHGCKLPIKKASHIAADLCTTVRLYKGGSWRYHKVHELVSEAFLEGKEVEHIDGDRKNNSIANLRIM